MDVERNIIEHSPISESPDEVVYFNDGSVSRHARNDE
jgi:hypothetical protein